MQVETLPQDPVAAVTHPNPYPYYADLVAHKPLYFDPTLGCWVASSAEAVTAVLTSDLCRVRPIAEPVPRSVVGSPAADIFQYLVRMNDGNSHQPFKQAVSSTLYSVDPVEAARQGSKWARVLFDDLRPDLHPERLSDFAFHLPIYTMASLLGVPEASLHQTALWISDYVACVAPGSSQAQIEQGKQSAAHLLDLFHALLTDHQTESSDGLLVILARQAKSVGRDNTAIIIANAIGFLSQAYDATAGLIGNTLLTLAIYPAIREQISVYSELLNAVIREVLRFDPPVQNTRRYLAQSGMVAGQTMSEGDAILVILAAANRDPSANSHPDRFDMFREKPQLFTFGVGVHACPGEHLATAIAAAALEPLMTSGMEFDQLPTMVSYRPSANARIPIFARA